MAAFECKRLLSHRSSKGCCRRALQIDTLPACAQMLDLSTGGCTTLLHRLLTVAVPFPWPEASLPCWAFLRLLLREPLGGLLDSALLGPSSKLCPGTGCLAVLPGLAAVGAAEASGPGLGPVCQAGAACAADMLLSLLVASGVTLIALPCWLALSGCGRGEG